VAYSLGITDLDPIEHQLLFERFLNPGRVSMPDFDIDFCKKGRDDVINYVSNKYGKNSVSQIITFGRMTAKMVVRDTTRALGLPYRLGSSLSSMISNDPGVKLDDAIQMSTELNYLMSTDEDVSRIMSYALQLEGKTRHVGTHAGGILIAPGNLTDHTPLYCDSSGEGLVSQFDKDDVEKAGLVKFDFLGLRTLTVINDALKLINRGKSDTSKIRIEKIPMDDERTFELLLRSETTAVFQLESSGMKSLIKKLKPENFEEIVALVALFRPGPLQAGMVDDFVDRKHGVKKVTYLHPKLEKVLKNTYGVFVYQEQIMQSAQELAGFTLAEADLLRRAMGKKKPEEMEKQRSVFVNGSIINGIAKDKAEEIFNLMEKFSGYGFNKSHSAAYGLIAFQTAWLKAHYPVEFMAATLSSDMDKIDKMIPLMEECSKLGIKVVSPDINISDYDFQVNDRAEIVMGLGAVKGMGEKASEKFLAQRDESGPVKSYLSLFSKYGVGKRFAEAAASCGALDEFNDNRAEMFENIVKAQKAAKTVKKSVGANANADMFMSGSGEDLFEFEKTNQWSDESRIEREINLMGVSFSGHPLDTYKDELKNDVTGDLSVICIDEAKSGKQEVVVAGQIIGVKNYKKEKGMAHQFQIDDGTRRVTVWSDIGVSAQALFSIEDNKVLVVAGSLTYDEKNDKWKIKAEKLTEMEQYRNQRADYIVLKNPTEGEDKERLIKLINSLPKGFCKIKTSEKLDNKFSIKDTGLNAIELKKSSIEAIRDAFPDSTLNVVYRGGLDDMVDEMDEIANMEEHEALLDNLFETASVRLTGRSNDHFEPSS